MCARLRVASTVAGGEFHSPRVDFAARLTGFDGNDGRRFLDRQGFERLGEPAVEFLRIDLKRAIERRSDQKNDFAFWWRFGGEAFRKFRQRAAPHGFEYFGELPRERRISRPQNFGQIIERFGNAVLRLEKDERAGDRREQCDPLPPGRRFW